MVDAGADAAGVEADGRARVHADAARLPVSVLHELEARVALAAVLVVGEGDAHAVHAGLLVARVRSCTEQWRRATSTAPDEVGVSSGSRGIREHGGTEPSGNTKTEHRAGSKGCKVNTGSPRQERDWQGLLRRGT